MKAISEAEIEKFFGDKIRKEIDSAVSKKVKELVTSVDETGRRNELSNALARHLQELLGRIERGMTVEVRFIEHQEQGELDEEQEQARSDINELASALKFPPASPSPVLQITRHEGG